MKARSVARELALIALFQSENKKSAGKDWARLSLDDLIVETVRSLNEMAQEEIDQVSDDLGKLHEAVTDAELSHPDNRNVPTEVSTRAVPLPTTKEILAKLEALSTSIEKLESALVVPEIKALSNREDVRNYALMLLRLAKQHQSQIDGLIESASTDWRLERIQKMDLALLRLGIAELQYVNQVEPATVIDETLELARRFSSEESRKFIHGILGTISQMPQVDTDAETIPTTLVEEDAVAEHV